MDCCANDYYFRVITISADAGFYLILALSAKHLGSDDPTYLKTKGALMVVAGGRSVGESVEYSPQHRARMQNGVLLHGLNQTVRKSQDIKGSREGFRYNTCS